jgi:hypothetical protein
VQISGKGVEDSYRLLVSLRWHGHVHLASSNINTRRIGLSYGSIFDRLAFAPASSSVASLAFLVRLPYFTFRSPRSTAAFRLALFFAGCLLASGCGGCGHPE